MSDEIYILTGHLIYMERVVQPTFGRIFLLGK